MEALKDQQTQWWRRELFSLDKLEQHKEKLKAFWVDIHDKFPAAECVTIMGSTVSGYAEDRSDVDGAIFFDNTESVDDERTDLEKDLRGYSAKYDNSPQDGIPIELQYIDTNILKDPINNPYAAEMLIFPGLGNVNKIRKIVSDSIKHLSQAEKEKWVESVLRVAEASIFDRKLLERNVITREEIPEFLAAKRELIKQRIESLFIRDEACEEIF